MLERHACHRDATCLAILTLVGTLAGCGPRPGAEPPSPATAIAAPFLAQSSERDRARQAAPAAAGSPCTMTGRFEGSAHPEAAQLQVVVARGAVAMTRSNDKQWDDLHLRVELIGRPPSVGRLPESMGRSETVVLSPTVDTAGPSLTTWQSGDTLRLLLPWARTLGSRRLLFFVTYHAMGFDGKLSKCAGLMISDTLRFSGASADR